MTVLAPLRDICENIHRRLCPLYTIDETRRIWLAGSGVPFDTGTVCFILTAAHVFGERSGRPLRLITLGADTPRLLTGPRHGYGFSPGSSIDADVALIGLSADDVADLRRRYHFTVPVETATVRESAETRYLLAGYPATKNRVITAANLKFKATPTYIFGGELVGVAQLALTGKTADHHFAISVPKAHLRTFSGDRLELPKPQGMSGGGVWALKGDPASGLWSTPQLVGIGIEHLKAQELFVATRVQVGIPLAREYAKEVRQT
jgi:hypothetical protein